MAYALAKRAMTNGAESWTITVTHLSYVGMAVETDMYGTESDATAAAVSLNTDVNTAPQTYFGG